MTKIKIGIIGAGYIAGVHAGILANDERVSLTAIHDVVPECAEKIAHSHNAKVVSSSDEVIDSCDVVFITTPNTKHVPLAISAIERVEVFCHHSTLVTREMETLVCSSNISGHFTEQSMQQLRREEKWGYVQEDRAFIDAIINGTPPPVTAFDGLMSVKLVEAVYSSVRSGQQVIL